MGLTCGHVPPEYISEKEHEQFMESCLETDWSDRGIPEKNCVKE
jgi:hypothetical protein